MLLLLFIFPKPQTHAVLDIDSAHLMRVFWYFVYAMLVYMWHSGALSGEQKSLMLLCDLCQNVSKVIICLYSAPQDKPQYLQER